MTRRGVGGAAGACASTPVANAQAMSSPESERKIMGGLRGEALSCPKWKDGGSRSHHVAREAAGADRVLRCTSHISRQPSSAPASTCFKLCPETSMLVAAKI